MALNVYVNITISIGIIISALIMIDGAVPKVSIEALRSGGFRVMIPVNGNITVFKFDANINEKLLNRRPGNILQETDIVTGNYMVLEFTNKLNIGDVVNYRVFVIENRLGYMKDNLMWEVSELLNSYPQIPTTCVVASTIVNGRSACVGNVIFEDFFDKSAIDFSKWMFEHKIPTNSQPDFEFNSYQNIDETRFIKNNVLYLQPIALKEENDVRGILNLREGCTSKQDLECFYNQSSAFLLPPVKSAKMKSLTKFKYGRIEIQAKLPAGDWIVPIIQLQPSGGNADFPKIWITYSRGNNQLKGNLNDDIGSRLLFAGPVLQSVEPERSKHLVSRKSNDPYYNNFHLYTLEWLPSSMKFYFNSQLFGEVPTSSFNSELQLSLGVSVGGLSDFPDGYYSDIGTMGYNGTKPWWNTERNFIKQFFVARNNWLQTWNDDDTALKINYVKITAI